MAKRRRLSAPSAEDLSKIEEEFRRETSENGRRGMAPIAQVAADTAQELTVTDPNLRAAQARDAADAERLREAEKQGLILLDLPLDDVLADAMVRDRSVLDKGAMDELQASIALNGQRLPIEVYEMANQADGEPRYGVLSGYRRLRALQNLRAQYGAGPFDTVRAILRDPKEQRHRFAAMVEENEIRQSLSHYERGRIAVIAAQQGAFANTEEAVNAMFPVASKAKRSKIRSFALIFEELGDLLNFPENLREKDGLKVAAALRDGAEEKLRAALETGQGTDAASELALLEAVLDDYADVPRPSSRGGRPKVKVPQQGWQGQNTLRLSNGIILRKGQDSQGYVIHLSGDLLTPDLMESLMDQIRYMLEKP
ncbi:ParB/RepB/Spo0J family partition protein [Pseudaestuariivita rosea]|uniref:ParB/RepB/Spo0J family partition protein n=1 Tax=Pseudaestuariivita rosea TaxID=2763263 RepID=UPI001ABB8D38|nr:ParB/RepB/Spo0J family partition protein [Pseudaestuariivita rosea]